MYAPGKWELFLTCSYILPAFELKAKVDHDSLLPGLTAVRSFGHKLILVMRVY